jgi:hypothetical protein
MKKMAIIIMGVVLSFVLFLSLASAQRHGGGYYGGGWHSGGHSYGCDWHHYGGWHDGWRHGYYPRGYWWGPRFYPYPGWWWPYPYVYPYAYPYPYPFYLPPPEVTEQPPAYSKPEQEQPYYWYYCPNPQGYYPYIKSCPGGWVRVVPNLTPPNP